MSSTATATSKARETLGSYLNIDAGYLGTREYYVPCDAILETRGDAFYL